MPEAQRSAQSTARLAVLLLTALLLMAASQAGASTAGVREAPADNAQVEAPRADLELLETVMEEGGVATGTPRPQVMQYVGDVATALLGGLFEWLFGSDPFDESALRIVRWMITGLLALLAAMLLYKWWRWWQKRHPAEPATATSVEALATTPEVGDWRCELEVRLERGDAAGALEALWWWLAVRLAVADADASWTTRELARRAGRRDLMPLVRRWDRLVYGGGAPAVEPVRALWRQLDEALP